MPVIAAILLGFLFSSLLQVMHEASHRHIARDQRVNDMVGLLAGLLLTVNYPLYRRNHLRHHRQLGTADDPEEPVRLDGIATYLSLFSPRYFLWPMWRAALSAERQLRAIPIGKRSHSDRAILRANRLTLAWAIGLAVLTAHAPLTMLAVYWAPLAIAAAFMFFTTLPEHLALPADNNRDTAVTHTILTNPIMRFFLLNTNYHAAHHARPDIPSLSLDARSETGGGTGRIFPSYLKFHAEVILALWRGNRIEN